MTRQISPAQVVIIVGGMYAARSDWIDYEISEARRMNKTIIGVAPWGQERIPLNGQNASSCPIVHWQRARVVQAVRNSTEPSPGVRRKTSRWASPALDLEDPIAPHVDTVVTWRRLVVSHTYVVSSL